MIIIPENLHPAKNTNELDPAWQNLACAAWQAQKVVGVGVRWEAEKRESGEKRREPLTLSPQSPSLFPFLPIRYPQTKLCRKPSHSRTIIIQIQEALWRKSNNLRNPYLAVMKSSTFHKRSKRMLLHQRANQCRPAMNRRKSICLLRPLITK